MTSSNQPRFRLLIGWCCLMSSAILIMMVYLTCFQEKSAKCTNENKKPDSTETNGKTHQQIDFRHGPSFNGYNHLIRDDKETWICSNECENSSFSLKNGTVEIAVSGLYYFHAQVYFQNVPQTNDLPTVTLLKNKGPGTQVRKLSEVKRNGPGSLTMIYLVILTKGDSISLNIHPINGISRQDYDTYWEIILFNNE